MTTALTEFFPYVHPHVAGCSEPMMEQAVRSACIDLCARSLLIQTVVTATVTDDVSDYAITVPAEMALARVMGIWLKDRWIPPSSVENVRSGLALRGSIGDAVAAESAPLVYYMKTPTSSTFSVYPIPDETLAAGFAVRAAFTPSRTATVVDDELFEDWAEVIASGAVAYLMKIPNQAFSNPMMAASYSAMFNSGAGSAAIQARSGKAVASSRVQPVQFT